MGATFPNGQRVLWGLPFLMVKEYYGGYLSSWSKSIMGATFPNGQRVLWGLPFLMVKEYYGGYLS